MNYTLLSDVCVEHNIPPQSYFWTWNESAEWQFRVVSQQMKVPPSAHFLDVGCGALRLGSLLIPYLDDNRYCGIDAFAPFVEVAPAIMDLLGIRKHYELALSDAFDFRRFARKFDFAFAQSVLTHINREDTRACFRELLEVMQPGGHFYASVIHSGKSHPVGMLYGGVHPFMRPAVPAGNDFYLSLAEEFGLHCERTRITGGQLFLRFDFPGLPRAGEDEVLRGDRHEWVSSIAGGAQTISQGVARTREEIARFASLDDAGIDRLLEQERESNRREREEALSQDGVTELVRKQRYSWINNALNNVTKAADAEKAALRLHAAKHAVAHAKSGPILDYGCGAGALSLLAHALGAGDLTLAEVSDEQLAFATWRLEQRGADRVARWNIIDEAAPERRFAAVLVIDVLPVIADSGTLIDTSAAVLADDGVIVVNFGAITAQARQRWAYLIGEDPEAVRKAFSDRGFRPMFEESLDGHTLAVYRRVP
jgi:cyclopropane fatty-acyl-phospholipid synthase-like methyltransferase